MKRKTNYKNLISLALVLILLFCLCMPSSFALGTQKRRFGAMVLSALQAINIYATATLAPAQSMLDAIADPPGYEGTYTYPWEPTWDDDYLNRTSIEIWPDYTEIDGVKYTDVWLSHDAAEKFRVNAFDWKTAYNITSESQGTFADGVGHFNGIPLYDINGTIKSQTYTGVTVDPVIIGNGTASLYREIGGRYTGSYYDSNGISIVSSGTPSSSNVGATEQSVTFFKRNNYTVEAQWKKENNVSTGIGTNSQASSYFDNNAFEFDWVSGEIPADTPLPSDQGLMIRVPSNSPGLQDFVTDNPDFSQPGGIDLDFDLHPELKLDVEDLLDILMPIIPVVNVGDIQFTVNHEAPIPPVPDVPIVDATVPQVVNPIINEITNYGDQITQQIPNIIETIPTIDDICNNIDTAPYHDLDTGLDHLPTVFVPFITDLRSALGIWHYVTEWLAQISTTFAFITGCLTGTAIMTPIYAGIAGFICIKVYRRMTG